MKSLHLFQIVSALRLQLQAKSIFTFKSAQQRHPGPDFGSFHMLQIFHRPAQFFKFRIPPARHIAVIDQAMPEHLGAAYCAAETEINDRIRPMGKCLHTIAFDHSWLHRRRHRHPAPRRTAQLLHNPKVFLLHAPDEIQMKGVRIISLFRQHRRRIIVIRAKIQLVKQLIKIRHMITEPGIGGNRGLRKILPQQPLLKIHIIYRTV